MVAAVLAVGAFFVVRYGHTAAQIAISGAFVCGGTSLVLNVVDLESRRESEALARERLRKAELDLGDALRYLPPGARIASDGDGPYIELPNADQAQGSDTSRPDERLALAALWTVTHERLDLYHRIATGQARRSFITAQFAMITGFGLLIVFAIVAVQAHTAAAAIAASGLGAVSAAFAGYIGRTFVQSQQSAAAHLRAYFDQPLEFSRYLAAERLLAASDVGAGERGAIVHELVQAIIRNDGLSVVKRPRSKRTGDRK